MYSFMILSYKYTSLDVFFFLQETFMITLIKSRTGFSHLEPLVQRRYVMCLCSCNGALPWLLQYWDDEAKTCVTARCKFKKKIWIKSATSTLFSELLLCLLFFKVLHMPNRHILGWHILVCYIYLSTVIWQMSGTHCRLWHGLCFASGNQPAGSRRS